MELYVLQSRNNLLHELKLSPLTPVLNVPAE